jgi:hypothetical protein
VGTSRPAYRVSYVAAYAFASVFELARVRRAGTVPALLLALAFAPHNTRRINYHRTKHNRPKYQELKLSFSRFARHAIGSGSALSMAMAAPSTKWQR